jgi:hypothetical protein
MHHHIVNSNTRASTCSIIKYYNDNSKNEISSTQNIVLYIMWRTHDWISLRRCIAMQSLLYTHYCNFRIHIFFAHHNIILL